MKNDHYYNEIAASYNELHGEEQLKKLELIKTELLRNNLLTKNALILDIGAGTGLNSEYIGIKAVKVISLEPAFELLKMNNNKYRVQGVAEFLPFKNKSFEIVQSVTAIHNFDDVEKAIGEMKRVGKKNTSNDKTGRKYFVVSVLKKSKNANKITKLLRNEFRVIKEIEEEKDIILILK